ncbi:MAG: SDR family NAD(P)-dependent oxidoreductase, partial [Chitinivibrionales bacterium]|nr:SDR family NAD(P)-dependent oxidoreductase [Chitinivibrionales bacterium]
MRLRVGVTGGTGLLGRNLVPRLIAEGHDVRVLCRNPAAAQRKLEGSGECIEGDITRPETLPQFVDGIDVCIHLAAQVDHASKETYHNVNVMGTQNLCDAILGNNPACRLIHCSSVAVLRLHVMKTEYSRSKKRADRIVERKRTEGLRAAIVYSGLIYGPGDQRLVPHLLSALRSKKLAFFRGGESWA